jgi:hypothetical protein
VNGGETANNVTFYGDLAAGSSCKVVVLVEAGRQLLLPNPDEIFDPYVVVTAGSAGEHPVKHPSIHFLAAPSLKQTEALVPESLT